ncbi:hypothetical protein GcM1_178002 [Golovinomyces cichoracearum]|uniref:Uncharacterized protein n=1 Tax=Golovinomyces cichoracearum TaxID=62708 RepID=A0A420J4S4_9PEZI|nr:hypothetical protein GcM1_178002 [Golovinomyces cichoracearum]
MDDDLPEKAQKSTRDVTFWGNETTAKATPITHRSTSVGSSTSVPKSTGNLFPYFHGLIQTDNLLMNNMILRYFYQLLGRIAEQCQEKYAEYRHGVNSLATTSQGMILCHILLGVDLALSTQSRCYVIIKKSSYQGFCLLGARYAIFSNSKWFVTDDEEDFQEQLTRMDPHGSAVDNMIEIMTRLTINEQYSGSLSRKFSGEPSTLIEELSHVKLDDIDDDEIRELDRCIRNLNYMGTRYLTKNPQMVTKMLATLAANTTIPLTTPTYLPSVQAPFSSDFFKLLYRFVPDAPSF